MYTYDEFPLCNEIFALEADILGKCFSSAGVSSYFTDTYYLNISRSSFRAPWIEYKILLFVQLRL